MSAVLAEPAAASAAPAPFRLALSESLEIRALGSQDVEGLFRLIDRNRAHLRPWHPWVDLVRSEAEVVRLVGDWQRHHSRNGAEHAGIWYRGELCGCIEHLNVDWVNRWTVLSYWLDRDHQGMGIMTACCRAMILHAFGTWNLNRVTIECAVTNRRSRAIPERLGFTLEGTVRGIERLGGVFVDHALYGLLRSDPRPWSR